MAALYWFRNDLRVEDNSLLTELSQTYTSLYCCYIIEPQAKNSSAPFNTTVGKHRWSFLKQSLQELTDTLRSKNITLLVLYGVPEKLIPILVDELSIDTLGCANQVGYREIQRLKAVKKALPKLRVKTQWLHTLYEKNVIDNTNALAGSFSKFRKTLEKHAVEFKQLPSFVDWPANDAKDPNTIKSLSPFCLPDDFYETDLNTKLQTQSTSSALIVGGCHQGLIHMQNYFLSGAAEHYKQTRNDLHGLHRTTMFSPWLALGCLSPKQVWRAITEYEHTNQANDSTKWLKFELLWREYFQWLARHNGNELFTFKGSANTPPNTSFYSERFKKWCTGNTPYPLVNALMNQLNETGFMSNRGRQIVASCLVNELQLDWRYGASYFEQQLIDYDVASNWGNWQYIAGVGADPRGGRWFNIDKQSQYYDADGEFTRKWQGDRQCYPLDSVDLVDWPVADNHVN
ncbi:DASH family cryptochrome [Paraglaciecola aquimarina]|uniref:Cryptochrome DASH n=1 Tax=Paraglaciecola algarum TaxID=3050085 RepID=A0ABS9D112_9ALTE|nr:DASH family cryptochrome [Paraglaciecola sp. G1-23]MCF2946623.1 DASH family cryptochrome [Paraglaciecola sp. G1-23]